MINEFVGEYAFLGMEYPCKITIVGKTFENVLEVLEEYKLSNDCEDWEKEADTVLCTAVMAKFIQNDDLALSLMNTGNKEIVFENKYGDTYLGTVDGVGDNRLGKVLMSVRSVLLAGTSNDSSEVMVANIHVHEGFIDIKINEEINSYPKEAYRVACAYMNMSTEDYNYFSDTKVTVEYRKHYLSETEFVALLSDIQDIYGDDTDLLSWMSKDLVRYYLRDLGYVDAAEALIYNGF